MDKDLEIKQNNSLKYAGIAGIAQPKKKEAIKHNAHTARMTGAEFEPETINSIIQLLKGKRLLDVELILDRTLKKVRENSIV